MSIVRITRDGGIATVTLDRPKVNAISETLAEEISARFEELRDDSSVRGVILTGAGKFFSFGFDTAELYEYSKKEMRRYLTKHTGMYTLIFTFPKPVVAALNGHCVAGGCMVALACDYRVMVTGRAKISLNEIAFGSSIFAGSVEMLRCCVGHKNAETVALGGAMYTPEQARELGLVDELCCPDELTQVAGRVVREMAAKNPPTYACIKNLLRGRVAEQMVKGEQQGIDDFLEIWYTPEVRRNVKQIMKG
jgi:enoyl-CoA hydratase/carnithine racemase